MPVDEVLKYYGKKNNIFNRMKYYATFVWRFYLDKAAYFCFIKGLRTSIHRWRGVNIGKNVYIGHEISFDRVFIDQIWIGDDTSIGDRSVISAHANIPSPTPLKHLYPRTIMQTHIGKGVWMMPNVIVAPGVTIHDYVVIATGAVITKDLPAMTLAVGSPAKPVKDLAPRLKEHIPKKEFNKLLKERKKMGYEP